MSGRGFTLVELLAVIVILSLLALITGVAVTKLVKDSKQQLSATQISLIQSAAEAWSADNISNLPEIGSCHYLTLQDLKDYGLLDDSIVDPKTNEEIPNDLKIKIFATSNLYGNRIINYEVNPDSVEECIYIDEIINPIDYTITYDLDGGTSSNNPTTYNVLTNTFSLYNPTKEGYKFLGWTGSNGNSPQTLVTITKGTTGNLSYKANYEKVEEVVVNKACKVLSGDINTVGSEVTCGDEHFYITSTDTTNNTVTMITKLYIEAKTNNPKQVNYYNPQNNVMPSDYGTSKRQDLDYTISRTSINYYYPYTYSNQISPMYSYIEEYKNYLVNGLGLNVNEARPISYKEVVDVCGSDVGCSGPVAWMRAVHYGTYANCYWTGNSCGNLNASNMISVDVIGALAATFSYSTNVCDIRPVIIIPISDIE